MPEGFKYFVLFIRIPGVGVPHSREDIDTSVRFRREFEARFGGDVFSILDSHDQHRKMGIKGNYSIFEIWARTWRRDLLDRVLNWMDAEYKGKFHNPIVRIEANREDPRSLAHARWVQLATDSYDAELGPADALGPYDYPNTACATCGWPDLEVMPSPLRLHPSAKKRKGAKKIAYSGRGVLVVDRQALDLLLDLIPDEVNHGDAVVRGVDKIGEFYWVRPRNSIEVYEIGVADDPRPACRDCGRLPSYGHKEIRTSPRAKRPFGYHGNLALMEKAPPRGCIRLPGQTHRIQEIWHRMAISGGLLAALYNSGAQGLAWLDPYMHALLPTAIEDRVWEETQRFADRFHGQEDRFAQLKFPRYEDI